MSSCRLFSFVVVSVCTFLLMSGIASGDPSKASSGTGQSVVAPQQTLKEIELYKVLGEERKVLERQAERHVASMEFLYGLALTLFSVLLAVGGGIFLYLVGKTKAEVKDEIKSLLKKEAELVVEKEVSELRRRQQIIKDEVDDLIAYKSRKVLWVAPSEEQERIRRIINVMQAFGVTDIEYIQGEEPDLIDQKKPDLVILSFDGTDRTRKLLSWIVTEIKAERPIVPLLIFTYGLKGEQHRLESEEYTILKGYDWYLPANVPATLLAQTKALMSRAKEKYISVS